MGDVIKVATGLVRALATLDAEEREAALAMAFAFFEAAPANTTTEPANTRREQARERMRRRRRGRRHVILARNDGLCGICGQSIEGEFHIDHIVPVALGGTDDEANLQPAHPRCNILKGASVQ